jgi:AcrR family transcriptional regulator
MKKEEKTKKAISKALIEILYKKPLDLITIKELCIKANVGRTAFYNNFHNKEDVLKYVYRNAHKDIFKDYFKDIQYLLSDQYIIDMIHFFDINSELLYVIHKWNLINIIARYNTEISMEYIKQYHNPIIKNKADYFVCYSGVLIFNMCELWILKNKDMTQDELFKTIKYFQSLYNTKDTLI